MCIALINSNMMKPPIAPVGLEYVAEALAAAGHQPVILDLCFSDDPVRDVSSFFLEHDVQMAGISFRNTDDCSLATRESFIENATEVVSTIRAASDALIVMGGVGFSVMPVPLMNLLGADLGIRGDGEFAFVSLARAIEKGESYLDIPGLVWKSPGGWVINAPAPGELDALPRMNRNMFDNPRYFAEGGQIGFETKRGCPMACSYCADPLAKGPLCRQRPPEHVADEVESLVSQGINYLHTCDGEFNIPADHAASICREFIRRKLGERICWYAYCAPVPFTSELAALMREAGCVGINFGADSGDEVMLRTLGRNYSPDDVINATRFARDANMSVMLDLLLGAPGESESSLRNTIDVMKTSGAHCIGVTVGVRLYPGTPMTDNLLKAGDKSGFIGSGNPVFPLFFLEPAISRNVFSVLDHQIAGDRRFLFHDPSRSDLNYNYNANQVLVDAIRSGMRGAYWDILRQISG